MHKVQKKMQYKLKHDECVHNNNAKEENITYQ
jgi:hypothetical protein